MVLGRCVLFPEGMLPLYIFEPRYRAMLEYALEHHSLFCIGNRMPAPPQEDWDEEDPRRISPVSTLALVRACVQQDDGTYRLILQGIRRIRLVDWVQEKPFRIAKIAEFHTQLGTPEETTTLANELKKQLRSQLEASPGGSAGAVLQVLDGLHDAERLCDFAASHFLGDPEARTRLLELESLPERLQSLLERIEAC
jgi:Lon protease-like protein